MPTTSSPPEDRFSSRNYPPHLPDHGNHLLQEARRIAQNSSKTKANGIAKQLDKFIVSFEAFYQRVLRMPTAEDLNASRREAQQQQRQYADQLLRLTSKLETVEAGTNGPTLQEPSRNPTTAADASVEHRLTVRLTDQTIKERYRENTTGQKLVDDINAAINNDPTIPKPPEPLGYDRKDHSPWTPVCSARQLPSGDF